MPESLSNGARHLIPTRWVHGTAFHMFLVLTMALLPLVTVAFVSSLRSISVADVQKHQLLRAATEQSAGKLASDITSIQTAQALMVRALESGMARTDACDSMRSLIPNNRTEGIRLLVVDRQDGVICPPLKSGTLNTIDVSRLAAGSDVVILPEDRGILVRTAGIEGQIVAGALLTPKAVRDMLLPPDGGRNSAYSLREPANNRTLTVAPQPFASRTEPSAQAPVGKTGIILSLTVNERPPGLAQYLSIMAPLVMWAVAAFLGWLVVRWLLILPMVRLQRAVEAYKPGQIIVPPKQKFSTSHEIAVLGQTFEALSAQVAAHDDEMRLALERQTKLTREVHHRVKNNLQIIASLINLHSRAATDEVTGEAYAAIQRRVDALAIVQRNHYAELENNRGLNARSLITEIAASLRASYSASGTPLSIQVDCDPVHLHQDVAAPVAFMLVELADAAMQAAPVVTLKIALRREGDSADKATLYIASGAFQLEMPQVLESAKLTDRILTGLSRQLREPLVHDFTAGEYCIRLSVI